MISGPIFQALRGLVDNRCYPSTFPQPPSVPEWPAIRYTISADANPDLCGTNDGQTDNFTVQFDCVGKTYGAADTLRDQVVAALEAFYPPARREFENEIYDPETKTHRVILVYSVHPSYIGPLQVIVREIAHVFDVCDVGIPVSNPITEESAAISDVTAAGIESTVAVAEVAAVTATDSIEPSALEGAGIIDVASAARSATVAVDEAAAAVDVTAAGGIATGAALGEATAVADTMASVASRQATGTESAGVSAPTDAETTIYSGLMVSWFSVTEDVTPQRAYLSWAEISIPEPDSGGAPPPSTQVFLSWAQIQLPESTELKNVNEAAALADVCNGLVEARVYVSWAQIEIPEP